MSLTLNSIGKIKSLKTRLTQQAQLSYSAAVADSQREEEILVQLKDQVDQTDEAWGKSQAQTHISMDELVGWYRYREALEIQVGEQKSVFEKQQENVRAQHAFLTQSFRAEKTWDHLLGHRQMEWRQKLSKLEQEQLDEVATSRFSRG